MTTLSTHVLDTASGKPVSGMRVHLARRDHDHWQQVFEGFTDGDGRITETGSLEPGLHRLGFETGESGSMFYPFVHVVFELGTGHHHIPLLISPYGYTTYRGS